VGRRLGCRAVVADAGDGGVNPALYLCVPTHQAQSDWHPDVVPALCTEVAPEGVIPVWVQLGSNDVEHIPEAA